MDVWRTETSYFIDLLSVLEYDKSGHGSDGESLSHGLKAIDVNFLWVGQTESVHGSGGE